MAQANASSAVDQQDVLLQSVLDVSRPDLQQVGKHPENRDWLGPNLDTPEGTEKIYRMLQQVVESPRFLHKISELCPCGADCAHGEGCRTPHTQVADSHAVHDGEVLHSDWWEVNGEAVEEAEASAQAATGTHEGGVDHTQLISQPEDDYVMIEKEDVVEALAIFVARYVVSLPQAQDMEPKAIQRAVANAFLELRMGRIRRMWYWGKYLYKCAALSYSAFSLYQHPWIVAAVLRAVYTSARVVLSIF